MLEDTPSAAALIDDGQSSPSVGHRFGLALPTMVDARVRNAQAPWSRFSSKKYYNHNYKRMQAEDQEIIHRVSLFFAGAFADRDHAQDAIDVGSGSNLYPALLMLPWANHILLTDYSQRNVRWLRRAVRKRRSPWAWQPFWQELKGCKGYDEIDEPRRHLKKACLGDRKHAGIRRHSVFELPEDQWGLGTMFFVAESISEDVAEFRAAMGKFVGALQSGAPFAAAFMAESEGYEVNGTWFPASRITSEQVTECFKEFGANDLTVAMVEALPEVREGYKGMIVATGIAGDRQGER